VCTGKSAAAAPPASLLTCTGGSCPLSFSYTETSSSSSCSFLQAKLRWSVCFFTALPCPALPCPALPCPALPCHAMPCPAMPCHALPCLALPCHVLPCHRGEVERVFLHRVLSSMLSCLLWSLPFLSLVSGSRAILMKRGCSLVMRSGRPVWVLLGERRAKKHVVRDEMT
jgi:hypothetical protein